MALTGHSVETVITEAQRLNGILETLNLLIGVLQTSGYAGLFLPQLSDFGFQLLCMGRASNAVLGRAVIGALELVQLLLEFGFLLNQLLGSSANSLVSMVKFSQSLPSIQEGVV